MLNIAQRLDLMKLAVDIAKSRVDWSVERSETLEDEVIAVFEKLKPCIETASALDDASMSDVKTAVDVASSLENLLD